MPIPTAREAGDLLAPLRSRLASLCDGVLEASWLLAAAVAPLYFNVHSSRVFEPDKAVLVRALALVALLTWSIRLVADRGRPSGRCDGLRQPLLPAVAAVMASLLLSTALSIAPRVSLFGSFERLQGLWTTLSYLVLCAAIVDHMRARAQVERLLTVVVVTSLPVALYGVLQRAHLDPLVWERETAPRVSSTLGSATFFAGHLVLASMIAASRVAVALRAAFVEPGRRAANGARAALYLGILLAVLVAIAWSGSRGPILAGLAGGYLFVVLLAFHWRRRALAWVALGLAVGALSFLLLLNVPDGPLDFLERRSTTLARLGSVLEAETGSARVRVLPWRGARTMMRSTEPLRFPDGRADPWHAVRPLLGYGPETLRVAYHRFYSPEIAQHDRRFAMPDRLHNEAWDVLTSTGLVGLLAHVALWTAIFRHGLGWLGLARGRRWRWAVLVAIAVGGGGGTLAAAGARGWEFWGVGLSLGMLFGLGAVATVAALARRSDDVEPDTTLESWRVPAAIGVFCALVAHFVETTFGVAGVSTRAHFWMLLAVLLVLGRRLPATPGIATPRAARDGGGWPAVGASAGVAAGPLLVLGCDFIGNPQRLTAPARIVSGTLAAPALLGLFGLTWLCGGILARLEDDRAVGRSHDARCVAAVLGLALLAGAAGWLAIAWHFAAIVAAAPATVDRIADAVSRVARLVDVHYALLAALALVWALCLRPARLVVARHTAATAALSWPLAVAVPIVPFLVVDAFSLPPIRADILAKAGLAAERQARHGLAEELFARALALAPAEDVLWAMWGRARSSAAAAAADPRQRDAYFASAREALERARRIQPLHLDHTVGLARLMRDWGASTEEPALRGARLAEADGLYETASRLAPASAWLWNEWAAFLLRDLQRPDRARANLERSLVLDPLFEETRWLQDELLRAGQRGARD